MTADRMQRLLTLVLAVSWVQGLCFAKDMTPVGSKQNPIKVNGVAMERYYCKFLRTLEGKEVEYERVG